MDSLKYTYYFLVISSSLLLFFFIDEFFVCYSGHSFSDAENPLGCDFKNTCRIKHLLYETNREKSSNRYLASLQLLPNG